MKFTDGVFRVSCCRKGHVTLEVLDGSSVKFVSVMSRAEAADLAERLASFCGSHIVVVARKVH